MAEEKTGVARWNEDAGRGRSNRAESDRRRRVALLVALCVVLVACVVCAWTPASTITRGLYLKGGTEVTLFATGIDDNEVSPADLTSAAKTIRARLSAAGVSESAARAQGSDEVVVDLPWNEDAAMLERTVCGRGAVEFVSFDEIGDADAMAKLNAGGDNVHVEEGTYAAFLTKEHIKSASVTEVSSGTYALNFQFDDEGTEAFAAKTAELAEDGGSIAILVDGTIIAAASVSEEITGGQVSITGNFDAPEANAIKAVTLSGDLPVNLAVTKSEEVGPLVGGAGLWGLVALALLAFVAATAYLYANYRKLAVLMAGSLATYAVVMLGLMALLSRIDQFVLTMPGVAGGLLAACITAVAVLRIVASFAGHVREGGSVRGSALTCVGEGLRVLGAPVAVCAVAAMVGVFLPWPFARELAIATILGLVSGLVAVFWFAVTLLRLLASTTLQARPASWGLSDKAAEASAVEGAATT